MTSSKRRNVQFQDIWESISSAWPLQIIAIASGIATFLGFVRLLADKADTREAVLAGVVVFLAVEWLLIYVALGRIGDQVNEIASGSGTCDLIAAPQHARMIKNGESWKSEGVVWIGVSCDLGSQLQLTMTVPAGLTLLWVGRLWTPHLWTHVGVDDGGVETWRLEISRTDRGLTQLGQFRLSADTFDVRRTPTIQLKANGISRSQAISHDLKIGLLGDLPPEELQRLPSPSAGPSVDPLPSGTTLES